MDFHLRPPYHAIAISYRTVRMEATKPSTTSNTSTILRYGHATAARSSTIVSPFFRAVGRLICSKPLSAATDAAVAELKEAGVDGSKRYQTPRSAQ